MLAQQVVGDPVQPWPRVGLLGVVTATRRERGDERLTGQLVGKTRADVSPEVARQLAVATVEQLRKACWLLERNGDQPCIGLGAGGASDRLICTA